MSDPQYPICPWCGIGPSIKLSTGTIDWNLESDRGNWQCGSFKHGVEPYQSPACRQNCCESRVEELETEVERLRAEHERLTSEVRDLEDCKEGLRRLGETCGCDHVGSPDERWRQVQHIEEEFRKQQAENERMEEWGRELISMMLISLNDLTESLRSKSDWIERLRREIAKFKRQKKQAASSGEGEE